MYFTAFTSLFFAGLMDTILYAVVRFTILRSSSKKGYYKTWMIKKKYYL